MLNIRLLIIVLSFFLYTKITCHEPILRIGLCIMATGKYTRFIKPLIESAEKYFLKNHLVTYFVFTDSEIPFRERVVVLPQKRLGWPYDTMMRFEVYYKNQGHFKNMDYIFAIDADMLFVNSVSCEILSERVAILHPGKT